MRAVLAPKQREPNVAKTKDNLRVTATDFESLRTELNFILLDSTLILTMVRKYLKVVQVTVELLRIGYFT